MGWETRSRGGQYYTRSHRIGGRVVREYVGGGLAGELAAIWDERTRDGRATAASATRAEQRRYDAADASLTQFCELVDLVAKAALLAAGYHQHHRGEWRKRRDEERNGD
jgi:hypothetical protein